MFNCEKDFTAASKNNCQAQKSLHLSPFKP